MNSSPGSYPKGQGKILGSDAYRVLFSVEKEIAHTLDIRFFTRRDSKIF